MTQRRHVNVSTAHAVPAHARRASAPRNYFNKLVLTTLGVSVVTLYIAAGLRDGFYVTGVVEESEPGAHPRRQVLIEKPGGIVAIDSSHKLRSVFRELGYDLDLVRAGATPVPRVFVGRLPGDIGELPTAKERKRIFIKTMLPLILRANEEVFEARTRLLALKAEMASGNPLSKRDAAWLNGMYARYQLPEGDIGALLGRVDVVPTSLALAQAAEESGWGTSRFALEGNALFGQYTTADGDGLMPLDRSPERRFKVRAFEGLQEAVKAYVHNLNTHPAYEEFRAARADMRRQAGELDSLELSRKLERYSARGPEYVESIQRIIYTNDLIKLDRVQFSLPSA